MDHIIRRLEVTTGYSVMGFEDEMSRMAYRFLMSNQRIARVYKDGRACWTSNGYDDEPIWSENSVYCNKLHDTSTIPDEAYTIKFYDGESSSHVPSLHFDLHEVRKSQVTEDDFWAMVRKLQYHRSKPVLA